mmetsp:Transcript_40902/g.96253  ORF Transcript_40902/g.96253 Transcript_40902/m.96253 type:complete len:112 (-) Transcript_40902:272-607(-)
MPLRLVHGAGHACARGSHARRGRAAAEYAQRAAGRAEAAAEAVALAAAAAVAAAVVTEEAEVSAAPDSTLVAADGEGVEQTWAQCEVWAEAGECARNGVWMRAHCNRACSP